jgi:hypothetical protein
MSRMYKIRSRCLSTFLLLQYNQVDKLVVWHYFSSSSSSSQLLRYNTVVSKHKGVRMSKI